MRLGWQQDAIFYIFLLPYCLCWLALNSSLPKLPADNFSAATSIFLTSLRFSIMFVVAWDAAMMLISGSKSPFREFLTRLTRRIRNWPAGMSRLPVIFGVALMSSFFLVFKGLITYIVPFSWDATFDQWDRALHFGHRPYELLQPLLGHPLITLALYCVYITVWFQMMLSVLFYYALIAPWGARRTQVLLTYLFTFTLIGTLAATLFSSAGPVYFSKLGLNRTAYAPLLDYLRTVNTYGIPHPREVQEWLWTIHDEGRAEAGISAMPSVHNATALLFVLVGWKSKPWIRNFTIAIFILIYLGSIHLGWHYAIDAYAAWALTLACWWISGRIARWWNNRISNLAPAI